MLGARFEVFVVLLIFKNPVCIKENISSSYHGNFFPNFLLAFQFLKIIFPSFSFLLYYFIFWCQVIQMLNINAIVTLDVRLKKDFPTPNLYKLSSIIFLLRDNFKNVII